MYARRNRKEVTNRNCRSYLARTVQQSHIALGYIVMAIGIILKHCLMRDLWTMLHINHVV